MNILLVNTLYHPNVLGGAERSVQLLAEELARMRHRVSVACCSMGQPDATAEINGVTVHYLRTRNVHPSPVGGAGALLKPAWHAIDSFNPLMASALRRIVARENPDVLHSNTIGGFSPAIWRMARQSRLPVVHTLRDYYLLCPRTTMFRAGRSCATRCAACRIFGWPRRMLSSQVSAVVGISRFLLEAHLSRGCFRDVATREVIRNAAGAAPPAAEPPAESAGNKLVLGYLGRLDPSKGIELFLDAARQLPPDRFEVVVAGKGNPEYESLLKTKHHAAHIRFLGFARPEDFFRQIHLLVVPSLWNEPLGRIVLEAHSHRIPVVASRRGGIPELVEEGKTGWLFEPDRPAELLETLRNLTLESCERLRVHCGGKAAEYSAERIASQYLDVYDRARHAIVPR